MQKFFKNLDFSNNYISKFNITADKLILDKNSREIENIINQSNKLKKSEKEFKIGKINFSFANSKNNPCLGFSDFIAGKVRENCILKNNLISKKELSHFIGKNILKINL